MALVNIFICWFGSFLICLLPTCVFEKVQLKYSSKKKFDPITRQCVLYDDLDFVLTSSLLSFYIPMMVMIFLYSKVFYVLRTHYIRNKRTNNTSFPQSPSKHLTRDQVNLKLMTPSSINEEISSEDVLLRRQEISNELRLTRSLAIVILCFLICWLPFFTIYVIRASCHCLTFHAIEFFVWLGYSNSSINPILYAVLNKNFRTAFQNLFRVLTKNF